MRVDVDASVATRAHQEAFDLVMLKREEPTVRDVERLLRRYVRAAVASFVRGHRVLTAAAVEEPGWRVPLEPDLLDLQSMQDELDAIADRHGTAAASITSTHMATALGIDFDQANRLLHGVIAAQSGSRITTAPQELARTMMHSLQQSYDNGLSIPHAARDMRKVGYSHSKQYAERIARTELIGAVNAASLAQVQGATTIGFKLWMATNDNRTRPHHREADGQIVPIAATFKVGGFPLDYPGDPNGPGEEVILCRCTMGYTDSLTGGGMATAETAVGAAWSGAIAFEGVDTGDGRIISPGALNWRELPIPLMAMTTSAHGPGDPGPASIAGRIETIERAGESINGGGVFDTNPEGAEAERLVREGFLTGISLDLAVNDAEIIPPENPVDEIEAMFGGTLNVLDGTILGATIVPFPAFENARIAIVAGAAMHMHHFRREDGRMVATVVMPFAPFPKGDGADPKPANTQEDNSDAADAIADITDAVNGWPGLDGKVVVTIDGKDTTISFPPAKAEGDAA